jgi:hypothetical protein
MDSFTKESSRSFFFFNFLFGGQGAGSSGQDCYNLKVASEAFTKFNSVRLRAVHHFQIGQLPQSKEALITSEAIYNRNCLYFHTRNLLYNFCGSCKQVPKKESFILILAMHILDPL